MKLRPSTRGEGNRAIALPEIFKTIMKAAIGF